MTFPSLQRKYKVHLRLSLLGCTWHPPQLLPLQWLNYTQGVAMRLWLSRLCFGPWEAICWESSLTLTMLNFCLQNTNSNRESNCHTHSNNFVLQGDPVSARTVSKLHFFLGCCLPKLFIQLTLTASSLPISLKTP